MRYLLSISLIAIIYFLILLGALYLINSITFYVREMPLSTVLYLTVTAIIVLGLVNLSFFAGRMLPSEATVGIKIAGATLVIVGAVFFGAIMRRWVQRSYRYWDRRRIFRLYCFSLIGIANPMRNKLIT